MKPQSHNHAASFDINPGIAHFQLAMGRWMRGLLAIVLVLASAGGLIITPAGPAYAAPLADPLACDPGTVVLNISDAGNCGSLRQTIADAPPGSTVTFSPTLAGQTIVLTNLYIDVTKTVTIDASDAPGLKVSGNSISSIFTTTASSTVTFTHISLVDGNTPGYGAAINADGNVVLISTTMSNNLAGLNGGAVAVNGSLVISGATFADNVSGANGGAVSVAGPLTVTRSVFLGNSAARGGAVSFVGRDAQMVNSLFARNSASASGAAIYVESPGNVQLLHNTIASPTVTSGAAIHVSTGDVNVVNTAITSYTTGIQNMTGTVSALNDLFFGTTSNLSGTITSNNLVQTCSAPYFVNPADDNYRLLNGSAAINAGANAGVTVDIDGNTRPINGRFDIGYYETSATDVAICNLTANNSSPNFLTIPTHFTATVGGGTNVVYAWDFGDGTTGSGATPTHTYTAFGNFTAIVTATNSVAGAGGSVSASMPITIVDGAIVGLNVVRTSPTNLGSPTAFTASVASGNSVVYNWSFGDGGTASGATQSHTYAALGNYTAVVTASNGISSVTTSTNVVVQDIAITGLNASSDGPTALGNTTEFSASITSGTNVLYNWSFADGQLGSGPAPTHTFASTGAYLVVVTATNATNVVSASILLNVTNAAPIPNAGPDKTVQVSTSVQLDGSGSTDPDGFLSLAYHWSQTSGTSVILSNTASVSPSFSSPAIPAVLTFQLIVTDGFGLVAAAPDTVVITVSDAAIAGLSAINDSPNILGQPTQLTATTSAGTNVAYAWNFGDGQLGSGSTPTHTYTAYGVYTAVVTATNSINTVVAQTLVSVSNAAPVAVAGFDQGVAILAGVQLDGSGSFDLDHHLPLTYRWAQTGGPAVTLSNNTAVSPTFTAPATPALLTFTLQVTDALGLGANSPAQVVVAVDDNPVTGLTANNNSPTRLGNSTTLTASITNGSNAVYLWNFGDGQLDNGQTISHTYGAIGVYTAIVTATNGSGIVTATTLVTITDRPIVGLVAGNNSPTSLGSSTNLTVAIQSGSNVIYTWNFGDGQSGSGANPSHTYGAVGVYTAVVTATNGAGSTTATTQVTIRDASIAGLSASSNSPNILGSITQFGATVAAGTNVAYTWNFGNGNTGIGANPTQVYSAVGIYTVIVTASNSAGSVSKAMFVTIQDAPISGLSASNNSPTALGTATQFSVTQLAGSNVTYLWAFGDGQTGGGANPQHLYAAAGSFTATVTATNGAGSVVKTTLVTVTNARPVAYAGPNQTVTVGAVVSLNGGASSDPENHFPLSYAWKQVSGTPVALTNPTSVTPSFTAPSAPAVLTFQVSVTDSHGLAALVPATVVVTVNDVGVAGLSASNNGPATLGAAIQFTATVTAGSNVGYTWDFGDGQSGSGPNPVHTYLTPGNFNAVVTATNSANSISATTIATVTSNSALRASLSDTVGATLITYTLVVTNAHATVPATGVMVTGSVPARAQLVSFTNANSITIGGDYANGLVRLPSPVTLAPGQSISITWTVRPNPGTRAVETSGHASEGATTIDLKRFSQIYGVFLPVAQNAYQAP